MIKGTLGSEGGGPLDGAKIHLTVSKGGLFDGISGEDFALDLATTGCASGDLATAGLCLVHQYATLLGVQDVQTTLAPRVIQTGPDTRVLRLGQRFRDVPVFGASVTLVVDGSLVRSITSTAVTSPEPQNATDEGLGRALESVTDADLAAAAWWSTVEDSDHDPADRAEVLGRVIVADRDDPESGAWLCGQVLLTAPDGTTWFVFVDLVEGTVRRSTQLPTDSPGPVQLFTGSERYPTYKYATCEDSSCSVSSTCTAAGADKCNEGGNCVARCDDDGDCGEDWECNTSNSCRGFCHMDPAVTPAEDASMSASQAAPWALFYWNGFVDPSVSLEAYYANAAAVMNDVVDFHVSDLGRSGGWDDNGGAYWLKLWGPCDCGGSWCNTAAQGCLGFARAKYSASGYSEVRLFKYSWLLDFNEAVNTATAYSTVAHEYTHLIAHIDIDGGPTGNKLGENIPDTFGALVAAKFVGGSDTTWSEECWNDALEEHIAVTHSPWLDETTGLSPGCFLPAYAQRSRYDMVPTQNAYANAPIWGRLVRMLAEGSDTFDVDDNDEDIGVTFQGVGVDDSIDAIYTAFETLSPNTTLHGWVRALEAAGAAIGNVETMRKALGAAGFFTMDTVVTSGPATSEAVAADFNAYTAENRKRFTAWRDSSNGIKVQYWYSGTSRTLTVGSNAAGHPSLIEYEGKLYVFWVDDEDDGTGYVHWRYFNPDGTMSTTYRFSFLYSYFWRASRSVDTAVFQGDLYVIYVTPKDWGHLPLLSRCTATTCTDSSGNWVLYDLDVGVSRSKPIPMGTWQYLDPGIAAVAAAGVGSVSGEYLYVAGHLDGTLTLGRIDDSDEVAESIDFAGLMQFPDGDYSPLDAAGQVGVEALPSALMPDASHLYIYWRADGTEDIYGMIVRDPAEETLSVTSVIDTFRSSGHGVSLVRGISTRDRIDMVYTQPSGAVSTSRQYGRY